MKNSGRLLRSLLGIGCWVFAVILGFTSRGLAAQNASSLEAFPMQTKSLAFRFNQSFFDVVSDLLEQIGKQAGLINEQNQIEWPAFDESSHPNFKPSTEILAKKSFIQYSSLKTRFQLYSGAIRVFFDLNITDAGIYKDVLEDDCRIRMRGPLSIVFTAQIPSGRPATITLDRFLDSGLSFSSRSCGFFTGTIGIDSGFGDSTIKKKFQSGLQKTFYKLFNVNNLEVVETLKVAEAFRKANIYLNQPYQEFHSGSVLSKDVSISLGIGGQLSNSQTQRITIANPKMPWLNQVGLEWTLDSGVQPESKNIFDPHYSVRALSKSGNFLPWGYAPYSKTEQAVPFDVGLMVKESFVTNLFEALYASGFFNMQIQESLLKDKEISIHPFDPKSPLKITMPNGQPLSHSDFQDARLAISFMSPPRVDFGTRQEILLSIPKFKGQYFVKTKSLQKEFLVVKFQAEFQLAAKVQFTGNGRLKFDFSTKPVRNFNILDRSGLANSMTNDQIESQLNEQIAKLLAKVDVEIPFLQKRTLALQYLGIDGRPENGEDKSLAVYIKLKSP